MTVAFSQVPGEFAVARLDPAAPLPGWAQSGRFCSVTRTTDELSIVCEQSSIPPGVRAERDWALLKLHGPFALDEVGVLSSFARPLAEAKVSVFAVATFDTDYLLVKTDRLEAALAALASAGHEKAG